MYSNEVHPPGHSLQPDALAGVATNTKAASTIPIKAALICFRMILLFLLERRDGPYLLNGRERASHGPGSFFCSASLKAVSRKCKLIEPKRRAVSQQVEQSAARRQAIERTGIKLELREGLAARVCDKQISRAVAHGLSLIFSRH